MRCADDDLPSCDSLCSVYRYGMVKNTMTPDLIIIVCLILGGFAVLAFILKNELGKLNKHDDVTLVEWLKSMQATIEHTNKTLNDAMRGTSVEMTRTLQSNSRQLNERLDQA